MSICSKCGEKNKGHASFCSKCGAPLKVRVSNKSHVIKRLMYVVLTLIILTLLVGGGYYLVDRQNQAELQVIKNLVIEGQYEEASQRAELLESLNPVMSLALDVEPQAVTDAIEEQRLCYLNKYPTFQSRPGIQGCVFWVRHNELEKEEVWINAYKAQEDTNYCERLKRERRELCEPDGTNYSRLTRRDNPLCRFSFSGGYEYVVEYEPRCNYNAFKEQKREENWAYLVSQEWDGAMGQCTLESCPLPNELNF